MECSALTACAQFRNKQFVELLYSGDTLANTSKYDDRKWQFEITAREKLFSVCFQIATKLVEEKRV